ELVHASHDAKADVVLQEVRQLLGEVLLQERHEGHDLEARPLPVLDRKRVERQRVQLEARAGLDGLADRGDAGPMAFDAGRPALLRPAAVPVHDDRDVPRKTSELDFVEELSLEGAGIRQIVEGDHRQSLTRSAPSSYETRTRLRPRAGAFGDSRRRSPPDRSSSMRDGSTRPREASARTPQIERTMPRRKPSPRKRAVSSSPCSAISTKWSVRIPGSSVPDRTAKIPKSRVPASPAAASRMRAASAAVEIGVTNGASRGGIT